MPTTYTEDRLIARSTLRHRPITPDAQQSGVHPVATRASRTHTTSQPGKGRPLETKKEKEAKEVKAHRLPRARHWLMDFGLGLLAAVLLLILGQAVLTWSVRAWDDLHYGMPRTYQTDAYVGHESGSTPSHFIALNVHGRIEVIELPGGDSTHAHIYLGPLITGSDADLVVVTISFVNLHHNAHQPDMVVQFQGSQIIFRNQNGSFVPVP